MNEKDIDVFNEKPISKVEDSFLEKDYKCSEYDKTVKTLLKPRLAFELLEFLEKDEDKLDYIFNILPERYATLLELYGDLEAAQQFRESPDVIYKIDEHRNVTIEMES